jgi:hypothetical protein
VRGPPGVGVGGDGGGVGGDGGLVPVAAPASAEKHRHSGADAMGHRFDGVPGYALARLFVGDVQDEGREYECTQWELVDSGAINKEV